MDGADQRAEGGDADRGAGLPGGVERGRGTATAAADLVNAFVTAGWITSARDTRALRLTPTGRHELSHRLGIADPG